VAGAPGGGRFGMRVDGYFSSEDNRPGGQSKHQTLVDVRWADSGEKQEATRRCLVREEDGESS
jgi:hypothetical protein